MRYRPSLAVVTLGVTLLIAGCSRQPTSGAMVTTRPQGLWVSDCTAGRVDLFAAGTLGATSTPAATISKGVSCPSGLAFDGHGNLWIANADGNTVTEYAAATLTANPSPIRTITGFNNPDGVAFDANGNLWVAVHGSSAVNEYAAASLIGTPSLSKSFTVAVPIDLAFDANGNLWVVSYSGAVTEYKAASLASKPTAGVIISAGLDVPQYLAFDANGNLWVGNEYGGTIVRYSAGSLASGSPGPAVTIHTGSPDNVGVALDGNGNLWVVHQATSQGVTAFAAAAVANSGSKTPIESLSGFTNAQMAAFYPPPSNLPLP